MAMGIAPEMAHGSLRLSLGRGSLGLDVEAVVETLSRVVARLRAIAPKFAKSGA